MIYLFAKRVRNGKFFRHKRTHIHEGEMKKFEISPETECGILCFEESFSSHSWRFFQMAKKAFNYFAGKRRSARAMKEYFSFPQKFEFKLRVHTRYNENSFVAYIIHRSYEIFIKHDMWGSSAALNPHRSSRASFFY